MEAQESSAPSKKAKEYAEVINSLLELTSDNLDYGQLEALVGERLNLAKTTHVDLIAFVVALARSLKSIREAALSADSIGIESPVRKKAIAELLPLLKEFCGKCAIDTKLALVGIRLRQGDFFILEDEKAELAPLLPSAATLKATMALCGLLTLPMGFKRPFGQYPKSFTQALSFESASESLCDLFHINPIVPRLAALDEGALRLVQEQFGFSRKAVRTYWGTCRWPGWSLLSQTCLCSCSKGWLCGNSRR